MPISWLPRLNHSQNHFIHTLQKCITILTTTKKTRNLLLHEFNIAVQKHLKPPRYKHFNTGSKLGCALCTAIRVGHSYLNAHSYSIGLAPENTCKCNDRDQETCLNFI